MKLSPEARWLAVVTANGLAQGRAAEAGDGMLCQAYADALIDSTEFADAKHPFGTDRWCLTAVAAYEVAASVRGL